MAPAWPNTESSATAQNKSRCKTSSIANHHSAGARSASSSSHGVQTARHFCVAASAACLPQSRSRSIQNNRISSAGHSRLLRHRCAISRLKGAAPSETRIQFLERQALGAWVLRCD